MKTGNRNFSMDLLRFLAMVGIFWAHSTVFKIAYIDPPPYPAQEVVAVFCVMVFFALSGYLFGAGFFRDPGRFTVRRHFLRRIIRIIPVYYIALFSTWLIGGRQGKIPLSCFFLLQNFKKKQLEFMPVSWSLCVEEWTYIILLLLFLLLGLIKKLPKDRRLIIAALILIAVSFTVRIVLVIQKPSLNYDFRIRKQTFASMDLFACGILASALEKKKPELFRKFLQGAPGVLIMMICLAGGTFGFVSLSMGVGDGVFTKIFGFALYLVGALLLILILKDLPLFEKKGFQKAGFMMGFLSKLTYPLYLIHFQLYIYWSNYCQYGGIVERGRYIAYALLGTFAWAVAIHILVELPLERLRKKEWKNAKV